MPDPRLQALVQGVESAHEQALEEAGEPAGAAGPPDSAQTVFPSVLLLLSGQTVSGRLVSSRTYLGRMRGYIDERWADPAARAILAPLLRDEGARPETAAPSRLYLVDAYVTSGTVGLRVGHLAVELSAVRGWTLSQVEPAGGSPRGP